MTLYTLQSLLIWSVCCVVCCRERTWTRCMKMRADRFGLSVRLLQRYTHTHAQTCTHMQNCFILVCANLYLTVSSHSNDDVICMLTHIHTCTLMQNMYTCKHTHINYFLFSEHILYTTLAQVVCNHDIILFPLSDQNTILIFFS